MTSHSLALGPLLRRWRDRLTPTAAGLDGSGRRRAAGLRREELSTIAGLSVDYITRLEQGRSVTPSVQVVASLARALQLDRSETELLYRSANLLPPGPTQVDNFIPPSVQRLVHRLGNLPMAYFTADWTLIQSTPAWDLLIGDATTSTERNLVRLTFAREGATPRITSHGDPQNLEEALVADLRLAMSLYPEDTRLRALVSRTRADSQRFAHLWNVGKTTAHRSQKKTITSELVGEVTLDCDVLTVPDSDIKLVIYTAAPGTPDAEKLDFLQISALQGFGPS